MFLGIEIGGTKLQAGLGDKRGALAALERVPADAAGGARAIRGQIEGLVARLRDRLGPSDRFEGIGVGFGGPVRAELGQVARSHQVDGWDDFPLADWCADRFGRRCVLHNDADAAGLAEAVLGAGTGRSPLFYITVGSGIGGGLIIDQTIYRGAGAGAAEIGHLQLPDRGDDTRKWSTLESRCSGWGIAERMRDRIRHPSSAAEAAEAKELLAQAGSIEQITAVTIAAAAAEGSQLARKHLEQSVRTLAWGINQVIRLVCPQRIVIGGGVSQLGEAQFFAPLRAEVEQLMFPPFRGQCDIVPAQLGETVVVQGALLLAAGR